MIRSCARVAVPLGVLLAFGCARPEPAAKPAEPAAASAAATPTVSGGKDVTYCARIRECTDCPNDVFIPTDCWTTQYGPARANVITLGPDEKSALDANNMLYCASGAYALCYFSGPPEATGKDPSTNSRLPCVLDATGDTALCTCKAYQTGPYFVDIHAIGNLRVYYQTVDLCGDDGRLCQNIKHCGQDGTDPDCANYKIPPVCAFVQNQNPNNAQASLIPGAELISTFSMAMNDDYQIASTDCPNDDHIPYAGCMTAPCNFPLGRPAGPLNGNPIECRCPTWKGPYQVGQKVASSQCAIPDGTRGESFAWSAAYAVTR